MEDGFFPFEKKRSGQEKFISVVEDILLNNKTLVVQAPTGIGKTAASISPALQYAIENKKKVFFLTTRNTHHQIALDTLKKIKKKIQLDSLAVVDLVGKKHVCKLDAITMFGGDFGNYCASMKKGGKCLFFKNTYTSFHTLTDRAKKIKETVLGNVYSSQEVKELSDEFCPYEIQINALKEADFIIGDYFHLFNKKIYDSVFGKFGMEYKNIILIADEAHNLTERIKSIYSTTISTKTISKIIEICAKLKDNYMANAFSQINSMLLIETERISKQKKSDEFSIDKDFLIDIFESSISGKINDFIVLAEKLGEVEIQDNENSNYLFNLADNLKKWQMGKEGFFHYCSVERGKEFIVKYKKKCIDPGILTENIFSKVHCSILMSATLTPFDMYISLLGLDKENTACLKLPSPFPKENRKILIAKNISSKYDQRSNDSYKIIADYVQSISKATGGNIAVFFPSYEYMNNVLFYVEEKGFRLLTEQQNMTKMQKERMYNQFKKCSYLPPFAVLAGVIGANFSEGVDFPGEIVKTVCIVGIPFEKTTIKSDATIKYYDEKFNKKGWDFGYIYPTINKTIQAAGRCIRSEKDVGAIVLLDSRYLMNKYDSLLPNEWRDKKTISSNIEAEEELMKFFDLK